MSGTVGQAREWCSAVRDDPALPARRFLFVSVGCAWRSFNGDAHTDTRRQGKARVARKQGDGAQSVVAILAPGRVAVKCQRADAMKKPMRSTGPCEPAGTMHVRCERYVARALSRNLERVRARCSPTSIGGSAAETQRAHHICARRKEATAPDAARRSGTHSASP